MYIQLGMPTIEFQGVRNLQILGRTFILEHKSEFPISNQNFPWYWYKSYVAYKD